MSKSNHRKTPEIPQAGNALEIPNYVTPTTDLEYREINDQVDPRTTDCRHRGDMDHGGENCRH